MPLILARSNAAIRALNESMKRVRDRLPHGEGQPETPPPPLTEVHFVKLTSTDRDNFSGLYPAERYEYDLASDEIGTNFEATGEDCWVDLINASEPSLCVYYPCKLIGSFPESSDEGARLLTAYVAWPVKQTFHAKLLGRQEVQCNSVDSGTAFYYRYTFIEVQWQVDDECCASWQTKPGGRVGVARHRQNRKIIAGGGAVEEIVEMEYATLLGSEDCDLNGSGSGSGVSGSGGGHEDQCAYVFDGGRELKVEYVDTVCIDGQEFRYQVMTDGSQINLAPTGLCCECQEDGSGCDNEPCETDYPDALCFDHTILGRVNLEHDGGGNYSGMKVFCCSIGTVDTQCDDASIDFVGCQEPCTDCTEASTGVPDHPHGFDTPLMVGRVTVSVRLPATDCDQLAVFGSIFYHHGGNTGNIGNHDVHAWDFGKLLDAGCWAGSASGDFDNLIQYPNGPGVGAFGSWTLTDGECDNEGSGSGSGCETDDCCECVGSDPLPDAIGTVTATGGCLSDLPGTINFASQADPNNPGKYRLVATSSDMYCAGSIALNDGTFPVFIDICSQPELGPQIAFNTGGGGGGYISDLAEAGWTCSPLSIVFNYSDGNGNTATVTVVEV